MNQEEEQLMIQQQEREAALTNQLENVQQNQFQNQAYSEENVSMIKHQLEFDKQIEMVEHLLRGHILKKNGETGEDEWVEGEDATSVILSNKGVDLVIRTLKMYLNKNTALSSYDETTIMSKMLDISMTLADTLFMSYGEYFVTITDEEAHELLKEKVKRKTKNLILNAQFFHKELSEEEAEKMVLNDIEDVEKERQKMKEFYIKNKLKGFEWSFRVVTDQIHSCFNRALGGGERSSLRRTMHASEHRTPDQRITPQKTANPLKWFKR